jgi:anthraniloyl-CoA monooxygenase
MQRDDARNHVRVYERDQEGATYGWGIVLSDVALSFVRELAPELYASLTREQVVFDSVAVSHKGTAIILAHTFHRMSRIALLKVLHKHCRDVGVIIEFNHPLNGFADESDVDLVVAADGANSAIRFKYKQHFHPVLDQRPNLLAWFGTTRLFEPLSLIFRQIPDGLIIAHAYQYSANHSTFLVEVDPETFHRSGLHRMSEAAVMRYCEQAFAEELNGHYLLSNQSTWFRYKIVKNHQWHYKNLVLLGDALRTGHPSIGSGTRLALQDAIALFDAYKASGSFVPDMLAQFVRIRQPGSDELQTAAIKSAQWFENVRSNLQLDPVSFAYSYLLRTGRVQHADVCKRNPELAAAYERLHPGLTFRSAKQLAE